jgi:Superfamily I DNA and RNA helicases
VDILRANLDPEQLAIATESDRSLVVLAGPGSGKTRLLTQVAAYQARRTEPANHRVLCLTFSVQATREMQARLAVPGLGFRQRRIHVANFHQLGSQLLAAYGHHIGWSREAQIADNPDIDEIIEEILSDLGIRAVTLSGAKEAIRNIRNNRGLPQDAPAESLRRIVDAYRDRLREAELRDYDDLILHTIDLLDAAPAVAEIVHQAYGFIVVDELQDTSGHQMELVARLSNEGETPIFAVADNDQMIYAWRDAREENIAEWQARFGARRVALLGNYRCPDRIVRAANALISHNPHPPEGLGEPYSLVTDRQGELIVARAVSAAAEANLVADIVCSRVGEGVEPRQIAILAANRFAFDAIGRALDVRVVPFVRVGEDPFATQPFARALRAAFALSVSADNLRARARFLRIMGLPEGSPAAEDAIAALGRVPTPWRMVDAVRDLLSVDSHDPQVKHAHSILGIANREFGQEPLGSAGRRLSLEWHRLAVQLQREDAGVKVMTTFAAKGLEYDTVILPSFGEGQVPYVARNTRPGPAWWHEERRKVYVALTRAQHSVYFVYSTPNPSAFLTEIPSDLVTRFGS